MGIEYALVHDETREAYELGKGLSFDLVVPLSKEDVRTSVFEESETWLVDDAYRSEISCEVWSFIEAHPGCHVVDDCGDYVWDTKPFTEDDARTFGEKNLFKQVGSRYKTKEERVAR